MSTRNICFRGQIRKISLFVHENICCGYSLEAPRRGTSNEYPQHMFSWTNKKNINTFGLKKSTLTGAMSFLITDIAPEKRSHFLTKKTIDIFLISP